MPCKEVVHCLDAGFKCSSIRFKRCLVQAYLHFAEPPQYVSHKKNLDSLVLSAQWQEPTQHIPIFRSNLLLSAQEAISSYFPHMVPFIDHTLAEYRYNDLGTVGSKIKRKMWSNESLDLVKGRKHSRRGKWYEDCSDKADGWRKDWYIPARVIKFYFVSCAPCIVIRIPSCK